MSQAEPLHQLLGLFSDAEFMSLPPGSRAALARNIDSARAAAAPQEDIALLEALALGLHRYELSLTTKNADLDDRRVDVRELARTCLARQTTVAPQKRSPVRIRAITAQIVRRTGESVASEKLAIGLA